MSTVAVTIDQSKRPVHWTITKGDVLQFLVKLKSGGVAQNVTPYDFRMKIKHPRSKALKATLLIGSGIEYEPDEMAARVTLDKATSALLEECIGYEYDLEVERMVDEYLRTPFGGIINVGPQTTD